MDDRLVDKIHRVAPGQFACSIDCFDGWFPILIEVAKRVSAEPDARVETVKQKWGGLRIYVSGASRELLDVVRFAEALSWWYCEVCGSPEGVETRTRRDPVSGESQGLWLSTLCAGCHSLRDSEMGGTWAVAKSVFVRFREQDWAEGAGIGGEDE